MFFVTRNEVNRMKNTIETLEAKVSDLSEKVLTLEKDNLVYPDTDRVAYTSLGEWHSQKPTKVKEILMKVLEKMNLQLVRTPRVEEGCVLYRKQKGNK